MSDITIFFPDFEKKGVETVRGLVAAKEFHGPSALAAIQWLGMKDSEARARAEARADRAVAAAVRGNVISGSALVIAFASLVYAVLK